MPKNYRRGKKGEDAERQRSAQLPGDKRPSHERELLQTLLAAPLVNCPKCDGKGYHPSTRSRNGKRQCHTCHGTGRVSDATWVGMVDDVLADGLSLRAQSTMAAATIAAVQRAASDGSMPADKAHRLTLVAMDTLRKLTELQLLHEEEAVPEAVRVTIAYDGPGDPAGDQLVVDASDRESKAAPPPPKGKGD